MIDTPVITEKIHINPAQQEAVLHKEGPCAVIAGPGSGKTFVLVERVCQLIESGTAEPSEILVLTFSRAAAEEMRSRFLRKTLRRPGGGAVFGTMHAVFYRILQESGREKLRLVDPAAKHRYLLHLCSHLLPQGTTPEELQLLISRHKNGLACSQKWLPGLVREYNCFLKNRGCLDFDDMILQCLELLRKEPDILRHWQGRFKWFLVDEFQDVSRLQYEVLQLLAAPRRNLFVVGDDDQSIYGFRGADSNTMQRFLTDYQPDIHRIGLLINYRCGEKILDAASSLIRENRNRIDKQLRSGSGLSGRFSLRFFSGRDQQYSFLCSLLEAGRGQDSAASGRAAVIFRTHAGARAFLTVLRKYGIPYETDVNTQRKHTDSVEEKILLDLTAYYRAAEDFSSSGIRKRDLQQIMNRPERFLSGSFLRKDPMTPDEIMMNAGFDQDTVRGFLDDLKTLRSLSPFWSFRYLMESVGYREWAETDLADAVSKNTDTSPEIRGVASDRTDFAIRIRNLLDSLMEEAKACPDRPRWITLLRKKLESLQTSVPASKTEGFSSSESSEEPPSAPAREGPGRSENRTGPENGGALPGPPVQVLTMHACKGLEFDTVFIPDLNEGTVPSRRSVLPDQIEEERRLLYVAMTRAKKALLLTCLEGTPDRPAAPSRFLAPFM